MAYLVVPSATAVGVSVPNACHEPSPLAQYDQPVLYSLVVVPSVEFVYEIAGSSPSVTLVIVLESCTDEMVVSAYVLAAFNSCNMPTAAKVTTAAASGKNLNLIFFI